MLTMYITLPVKHAIFVVNTGQVGLKKLSKHEKSRHKKDGYVKETKLSTASAPKVSRQGYKMSGIFRGLETILNYQYIQNDNQKFQYTM